MIDWICSIEKILESLIQAVGLYLEAGGAWRGNSKCPGQHTGTPLAKVAPPQPPLQPPALKMAISNGKFNTVRKNFARSTTIVGLYVVIVCVYVCIRAVCKDMTLYGRLYANNGPVSSVPSQFSSKKYRNSFGKSPTLSHSSGNPVGSSSLDNPVGSSSLDVVMVLMPKSIDWAFDIAGCFQISWTATEAVVVDACCSSSDQNS